MSTEPSAQASAYVKNGRLCILGVAETSMGPVPFAHHAEVGEKIPDGPVSMGDERVQFALDASREKISAKVKNQEMRLAAGSLVERARVGDQNAMAMIRDIGDNARRRSARARVAYTHIRNYIAQNPPGKPKRAPLLLRNLHNAVSLGDDHFGAVVSTHARGLEPYVAALTIANGGKITKERVNRVGSHFGGDEKAFDAGYHSPDPKLALRCFKGSRDAVLAGHVMRLARVIQGVRSGAMPIARLCPNAAWELGE